MHVPGLNIFKPACHCQSFIICCKVAISQNLLVAHYHLTLPMLLFQSHVTNRALFYSQNSPAQHTGYCNGSCKLSMS